MSAYPPLREPCPPSDQHCVAPPSQRKPPETVRKAIRFCRVMKAEAPTPRPTRPILRASSSTLQTHFNK